MSDQRITNPNPIITRELLLSNRLHRAITFGVDVHSLLSSTTATTTTNDNNKASTLDPQQQRVAQ
jgi:hypothetical protein